jgi:hypothetical protein
MPTHARQTSMTLLPAAGTTEALELGCTCQFIVHESAKEEKQPAGMLMDPHLNCPLHETSRDGSAAISI